MAATCADYLEAGDFLQVVKMTPLVSIDLIVSDYAGRVLVGHRRNRPALGTWFVPGGRIRKNESLHAALRRICEDELALSLPSDSWRLQGVYEHFYEDNFEGETDHGATDHDTTDRRTTDRTTHYVVLAYLAQLPAHLGGLQAEDRLGRLPTDQHSDYRWAHPRAMAQDGTVHPYTRAYFTEQMR